MAHLHGPTLEVRRQQRRRRDEVVDVNDAGVDLGEMMK
jgi:hypothetical protein